MSSRTNRPPAGSPESYRFWLFALLLVVILAVLFCRSFLPGYVHFNNDNPLGAMKPRAENLATDFFGRWNDLNSVGGSIGAATPNLSMGLLGAAGAVGFAKFYAPLALLVLGLGAWLFFRELKLAPVACILGGLAAALNSDFLATACWGVASQPLAFGLCYLALAAVVNTSRPVWVRLPLAGFAVGMAVEEAADIGAIFSIFVAAFTFYYALTAEGTSLPKRVAGGVIKVGVVALFAGWIALLAITELVGTQIQGVANLQDNSPEAKAAHWDWATQWSLPKREVLNLAVPGLFGYRMDSSAHGIKGGDYWGIGGRDPAWDRYFANGAKGPQPAGFIRYGGGGLYAGVLVVLVALWAAFQALRRKGSAFSLANQKQLWFWLGVMCLTLLLALGRFAPFYWFVYHLPFFSTIRNPAKFIHVFDWALIVLFAYGVHGMARRYTEAGTVPAKSLVDHVRSWWSRVSGFERKWALGCLVAVGVSLLGWFIYGASRASLEGYLQTVQFAPENAKAIAAFSIEHAGWFVLRLALAVALVLVVVSGWFAGARAKWAGILMGLFLAGDLAIANQPWIIYWDYPQKYASNPIVERLRQQPYEHRVAILPSWITRLLRDAPQLQEAEGFLDELYGIEWKQQLFQYYSIQTLDIVQMPRMPADLEAFERALQFRGTQDTLFLVSRRWQLTNTRYLLGAAPLVDLLNQAFDPVQHRFQIAARFNVRLKPEVTQFSSLTELTAEPATNGTYALFDFTGALPRAKLYTRWEVCAHNPAIVSQFINSNLGPSELEAVKAQGTNDFLTLKELASPAFDPAQTVLVAETEALKLPSPATNASGDGTVEFTSYSPKHIVLHAKATAPSVLLLNDKFDPGWKVTVDGKPETLLRCNYLMRGVQVPVGEHRVEFQFVPGARAIWVSVAALAVAVLLLGLVWFVKAPGPAPEPATPSPENGK